MVKTRKTITRLIAFMLFAIFATGLAPVTAMAAETGDVFIDSASGLTCQVRSADTVEIINSNISGNFSIPPTVTDDEGAVYTVTSIGDGAFANCTGLTGITIPGTVEYIYPRAFNWCTSLMTITANGPHYFTYNGALYFVYETSASLTLYPMGSLAESFDVPNMITANGVQCVVNGIGAFSFLGAPHLTTVTIPESIAGIGSYAFYNCINLKDVFVLAHMPNVSPEAFEGCSPDLTIYCANDSASDLFNQGVIDMDSPEYCASMTPTMHGMIMIDRKYYRKGENVFVIAVPDPGYKLTSIFYIDANGRQVPFSYDFNMPASDVTITAVFTPITGGDIDIPSGFLDNEDSESTMTIENEIARITVPANMLSNIPGSDSSSTAITVAAVNKAQLPPDTQAVIGSRPAIDLALTIDGEVTQWNNPVAPISVCIPYTPTAEELLNPDDIVVYYIDGAGNLNCVPNGHYNPDTRQVTFETTHFSIYAVGYNTKNFTDVPEDAWYARAVRFIAARDIMKNMNGAGTDMFHPNLAISRGQFIIMLMNAYGIEPAVNPTDNFMDAGNTNYTNYLAAAKALGIVNGAGDNMFLPKRLMTRQEMFTMLYNALNALGKLPATGNGKALSGFRDTSQVDTWARDAMAYFAGTGILAGNNGAINPQNTVTRAQIAQVIYSLLGR